MLSEQVNMPSHSGNQSFGLSEPLPLPPHLKKVLEDTGRGRFSSATPAPQSESPPLLSPKPNRAFHQQREVMNRGSFTSDGQTRSMAGNSRGGSNPQPNMAPPPPRRTPQDQNRNSSNNPGASPAPGFNRGNNSSSTTSITLRDPSRNSSRNSINVEPQTPNIARITKEFHNRIEALLNKIRNSEGISAGMQATLVEQVQSIAQEFNQQHRRLQDAFERVMRERNHNQNELKKAQADLQDARAERDHALQERDSNLKTIDELRMNGKEAAQKLDQIQACWKESHDRLHHKLAIQDEQLKGKRALWLDSNPGSSARRDAMNAIRDPFNSPTAGTTASFDKGYLGMLVAPSTVSPLRNSFNQAQYGPPPPFTASRSSLSQHALTQHALSQHDSFNLQPAPQHSLRKRGNMPTQRMDLMTTFVESEHKVYNTEPGSLAGRNEPPAPQVSIRADLAHMEDEELAEYYQAEFARLFSMVEGWVKIYCSQPNLANDRQISRSSQELWQYMMNCTYPGQLQDSHNHVMTLLNDARSRCWFVMRMIVGFCVKEILGIEVFTSFGAKQDVQLQEVKTKLLARGLNTEARQKLIDEQARIIEEILDHDGYNYWRNNKMNHLSKRMRDMVGPLLNDGAGRTEAGKDLGAIGMFAWKLTTDLHTSHLTFQVYFPETASKFNASTMVAKDQPRVSPLDLQIKQVRLKLVITPVVTLRDDRTTTIKAKSLHNSTVLIMG